MLGRKKKSRKASRIDTMIGKTTTIRGDVDFAGTLHVEGTIVGNVRAENDEDAMLILDEQSIIQGDVSVASILVNGTVEGDIFSSRHAELLPHAKVKGNVYYNLIEMSVGAAVNGSLVHREDSKAQVEYLDTMAKKQDKTGGTGEKAAENS